MVSSGIQASEIVVKAGVNSLSENDKVVVLQPPMSEPLCKGGIGYETYYLLSKATYAVLVVDSYLVDSQCLCL